MGSGGVNIGLVGHHLEEGWAGSGLVGGRRRRHWVKEAGGECGVEFGEALAVGGGG